MSREQGVMRSATGFSVTARRYVPFEPRHDDQRALKAILMREIAAIAIGAGQLLHACFAGELHAAADVENALLYNIGNLGTTTRNGVRFELAPPPTGGGVRYDYSAAPGAGDFSHWRRGATLAMIPTTELPATSCSAVWWALRQAPLHIADCPSPDTPFAVCLRIAGPAPVLLPALLKSLIDGVVCALQAHGDPASASAVAATVAVELDVPASDVRAELVDMSRAPLGAVRHLRRPTGWNPSDHLCVAGDLRFKTTRRWTLDGEVIAVTR
jgi:hypothetical protein